MDSRAILFISPWIIGAVFSTSAASQMCVTPPPGLQRENPDVAAEMVTFSYNSQSYPVEIYSAFAQQASPSNPNYCIRYEVENKASNSVQKFSFPVASGLEIEELKPRDRQGVLVTASGTPPTVADAWVYAFLSGAKKTRAYQKQSFNDPTLTGYSSLTNPQVASNSSVQSFQLAQIVDGPKYSLREPREFPVIGSEFSSQDAEVAAVSHAKWDGKSYILSVTIARNSAKFVDKLSAPFAYAFFKGAFRNDALLAIVSGERHTALPLSDNRFSRTISFLAEGNSPTLYVVRQPVTFERAGGRICFLAEAYSPVPIPQSYMNCDLTRN